MPLTGSKHCSTIAITMLLKLDPASGLPLYAQIAAAVRRSVADGDVVPGDRLPAARDLARSLDVNMHTVLRAYKDLQSEGVIELRRGRGAIIRDGSLATASIQHLVTALVSEAARHGVSADEVVAMVKKEFP